jgi:hypothetical protein
MKNQTAIEFLIKQFSEILGPLGTKPMQDLLMMDAIKKAKEMETEQIKDSHKHGFSEGVVFGASPIGYKCITSEQYYKQTYISNE